MLRLLEEMRKLAGATDLTGFRQFSDSYRIRRM
jgi:hypothetical protein